MSSETEALVAERRIPNPEGVGSSPASLAGSVGSGSLSPKGCDTASHSPLPTNLNNVNQGDQVRFKAHGETGLLYELLEIVAGDCELRDRRGRVLRNVPVELLERADECSTQKS
jgi:hypothetical protein